MKAPVSGPARCHALPLRLVERVIVLLLAAVILGALDAKVGTVAGRKKLRAVCHPAPLPVPLAGQNIAAAQHPKDGRFFATHWAQPIPLAAPKVPWDCCQVEPLIEARELESQPAPPGPRLIEVHIHEGFPAVCEPNLASAAPDGDLVRVDMLKSELRKVCSSIEITAKIRDKDSAGWGLVVRITDPDGQRRRSSCRSAT